MKDNVKEMLNQLWNLIGSMIGLGVNVKIIYDYTVLHQEPSNMMIYIALLIYMQLFLKHKDKPKLDLG